MSLNLKLGRDIHNWLFKPVPVSSCMPLVHNGSAIFSQNLTVVFLLSFFFFFFWLRYAACGILVPRPGIEPMAPAVEAWTLNHWTAKEVPSLPTFSLTSFQTVFHTVTRSVLLKGKSHSFICSWSMNGAATLCQAGNDHISVLETFNGSWLPTESSLNSHIWHTSPPWTGLSPPSKASFLTSPWLEIVYYLNIHFLSVNKYIKALQFGSEFTIAFCGICQSYENYWISIQT